MKRFRPYRTNASSSDNFSGEERLSAQEDFPIGDSSLQLSSSSDDIMEATSSNVHVVSHTSIAQEISSPQQPPDYIQSPGSVLIVEDLEQQFEELQQSLLDSEDLSPKRIEELLSDTREGHPEQQSQHDQTIPEEIVRFGEVEMEMSQPQIIHMVVPLWVLIQHQECNFWSGYLLPWSHLQ
jgi:hypothetical protein